MIEVSACRPGFFASVAFAKRHRLGPISLAGVGGNSTTQLSPSTVVATLSPRKLRVYLADVKSGGKFRERFG